MSDDDWKGEHLIRRRPSEDERKMTNTTLAVRYALLMKKRTGRKPPRQHEVARRARPGDGSAA